MPEEELKTALGYHNVRKKVNELMINKLLGRPQPKRKVRISPHTEIMVSISPLVGTYPSSASDDKTKLKVLKGRLDAKAINTSTYLELAKVLDVPKKQMYDIDIGLSFDDEELNYDDDEEEEVEEFSETDYIENSMYIDEDD